MAAHVPPRPAVEAAFLHVGDVIGNQVVAQRVALVDRTPQLAGLGIDGESAAGVADAVGVDFQIGAVGIERKDVGAVLLSGMGVGIVRHSTPSRRTRTCSCRRARIERRASSGRHRRARSTMCSAAPRAFRSPFSIRKPDHRVGVADIDPLRILYPADKMQSHKGRLRPVANACTCCGLPSAVMPRKILISPASLSATKKSPFGAVRMVRGLSKPVA